MSKKKWVVLVALIFFVGTVAGAVGVSFTQTVSVSYGEVSYVQSGLVVEDYSADGPGINVDTVDVTVNNTESSSTKANVTVYLLDSGSEVRKGSTVTTFGADSTQEVSISVSRIKESDFSSVDIRIEEST